jgi:hypothetical protein
MYKIVFSFVMSCLCILSSVQAAEWSLTGRLDPTVQYDDNVFMSGTDEESGTRYTMTPTATISRATESSNASLDLGYRLENWSSVNIDNSENPFANFNGSYYNERSEYGLALAYVEDTTRETAADDSGNFRAQGTITTKTIAPYYNYQLTERDTLSFNASYSEREYDINTFNDNELKFIETAWWHLYTERLSGGLSVGVYNYQADSSLTSFSVEHDNYNFLALLAYQLTELWQLDGRAGIRRLESELTNDFGFKEDNTASGTSYAFTATRENEIDTLVLGVSQELNPNSDGSVDEQQRAHVNWSRNLSETLTANIFATYLESESESRDILKQERKYYEFSPSIIWNFEENLGLEFGYRYRKQDRDGILSTDADSNSAFVALRYDWDGIRASR